MLSSICRLVGSESLGNSIFGDVLFSRRVDVTSIVFISGSLIIVSKFIAVFSLSICFSISVMVDGVALSIVERNTMFTKQESSIIDRGTKFLSIQIVSFMSTIPKPSCPIRVNDSGVNGGASGLNFVSKYGNTDLDVLTKFGGTSNSGSPTDNSRGCNFRLSSLSKTKLFFFKYTGPRKIVKKKKKQDEIFLHSNMSKKLKMIKCLFYLGQNVIEDVFVVTEFVRFFIRFSGLSRQNQKVSFLWRYFLVMKLFEILNTNSKNRWGGRGWILVSTRCYIAFVAHSTSTNQSLPPLSLYRVVFFSLSVWQTILFSIWNVRFILFSGIFIFAYFEFTYPSICHLVAKRQFSQRQLEIETKKTEEKRRCVFS